jgi:hypothetical protein
MNILGTLKSLYDRAVDLFDGDNNTPVPTQQVSQQQIQQPQAQIQTQIPQTQPIVNVPFRPTTPWINIFQPKTQQEKDKQDADIEAAQKKADAAKAQSEMIK